MLPASRNGAPSDQGVRILGDLISRSHDVDSGVETGQQSDHGKGPGIIYSVVSIFCMLLLATMLGKDKLLRHTLYSLLNATRFSGPQHQRS